MILFKADWKDHPSAIVHTTTKNVSWLRQAQSYAQMGIDNCDFLLALYNPELEFVDPFDPNLTIEQKRMVAIEARWNPWYFYREVARIDAQGSDQPGPLNANRGVISFLWLTLNHIDPILIQPRQTGKSVGADTQSNYVMHVAGRRTKVALLTKDDALRVQNVERLKGMRENLPSYLNPHQRNLDGDNQTGIKCEQHKNEYLTAVPRSSPAQARNVGRGMTAGVTDVDESPFIPHIKIIIPAMLSATNAARQSAMKNGGFYYNAFTTTAGDRSTESGAYIYRMLKGGMVWSERLFDCVDQLALHDMVRKNSPGLKALVNCTFSHRQLGYSDEYILECIRNSDSEGIVADMDYFNVWPNGSGQSPIPKMILAAMRNGIKEPVYTDISEEGRIVRWFIPESEVRAGCPNRRLLVGLDSSDAVGNDGLAMVIVDADTLETVGTSNVNEANLYMYGQWLAKFIASFKLMVLIPERKSSGQALIDSLLINLPKYGKDPFKHIYNIIVEDMMYDTTEIFKPVVTGEHMRNSRFYDQAKKYFGYNTSGSGRHSRDQLFNRVLLSAAKMCHKNVNDESLVNEITGLVVKNGRLDHAAGKHDDMTISWLLVIWMLTSTRNLDFYGLGNAISRNVDFYTSASNPNKSAYKEFQSNLQVQLKEQADRLLEDLVNCTDSLIAMRIESKLQALSQRLELEGAGAKTLDTMISEVKAKRTESQRAAARSERDRFRSSNSSAGYGRRY